MFTTGLSSEEHGTTTTTMGLPSSNSPRVEPSISEGQSYASGSKFGNGSDTCSQTHSARKAEAAMQGQEPKCGGLASALSQDASRPAPTPTTPSVPAVTKQSDDIAMDTSLIPSNISSKRNTAFHHLFPNVPASDYLIQEYGCTLERGCPIGGRLYLTENHICFYSNIYKWNSNFMIPFHEVTSIEKYTIARAPNAIRVYTRTTSYTFTSIILRDTVHDLMHNVWRLTYPELESMSNEVANSQDGTTDGLEHDNYFIQSTEAVSGEKPVSPRLLARKEGETVASQLSGASIISPKPTDMMLDGAAGNHPSLAPAERSTDAAERTSRSDNTGAPNSTPTNAAMHTSSPSPYPNEVSSILHPHPHPPQYMASTMHECLIQHGCLDLISLVDPLGFSTSAVAEGGYGDVWTGRFHKDGTKVAIKVLRFTLSTGDVAKKELKRTAREIYNWSKLDHENVNKLMGVIMFRERLGMVSEWMEHGNLRQYLSRNSGLDRGELCVQIARGVAYLHGVNMVHGDLKAYNILVSSTGIIKITDFDYSIFPECSLVFSATTRVGGGTLRWMAPELVLEENPPQRNTKTDVYALGMTLLVSILECYAPNHTHKYRYCS
ncbi:tyrosine kinase domain protein [Rhizoctonia solani AG-3 Rhs1AP]|uniref:Tyrosine kinase domain protein n=1 Tax=Rhizoctonia solani AG-3 Rhs1AP TaxID=1086054 RepID=X8JTG0_9AGAM|nr:tyrosine kinase domain protein [Rhizoctonia solani AG-3 Rhs1AP]